MNPKSTYISSLPGGTQTSTPMYRTKKPVVDMGKAFSMAGYQPGPQSIKPAEPAATAPVAATPKPAALNSPAAQNYMSTLGGAGLPSTSSQLDAIKKSALGIQDQLKQGLTPSPSSAPTKPPKIEENAYLKYLRTFFNPKEAEIAQRNVDELNRRTSEEIARTRKEEERLRKNESGMLEGGQTHYLNDLSRISNKSLADLAIAKGYATDILKQYTDAGATLYEAEQEAAKEANKPLSFEEAQALGVPIGTTWGQARQQGLIPPGAQAEGFTLGEGQARYDAQGNLIASRAKTYAPRGGGAGVDGGYTPGNNPTVDSWVNLIRSGQAKITSVPAAYKNAVAAALSQGGVGQMSETSKQAVGLIDQLIGRDTAGITGLVDQFTGGWWGDDAYTKNLYNQLKGLLSLDKRTLLKGSGAISDYEFKVLEQAASSLGRNLSNEDFRTVLANMKLQLASGDPSNVNAMGNAGGEEVGTVLVSSTGERFDASELTPDEYQEAIASGYRPE